MKRRSTTAGVTLVEMLVVLVLIGVLSGAAALSLNRPSGDQAELAALKLTAHLDRAVRYALDHQIGFGLEADRGGYSFWVPMGEEWHPHPDPTLNTVKLFPRNLRISVQDHDGVVFSVSRTLVPKGNRPWHATLGQGASARDVIFDGITARIVPAGGG